MNKEFLIKLLKLKDLGDYGEGCCCTKAHTFLWEELEMTPEEFDEECEKIIEELEVV